MLEQIASQPLHRVGWPLLHKRTHSIQQNWHHRLIQVGADRKGLQIKLLLSSFQISLGVLSLSFIEKGGGNKQIDTIN